MPDLDEINMRVKRVLVDALGAEEDNIKSSSTLQGDLGAESIDFLDIVFRLEREFGTRISRDDLFPEPVSPDDPVFTRGGRLTDEFLTTLRSRMPYADLKDLERRSSTKQNQRSVYSRAAGELHTVAARWRRSRSRYSGARPREPEFGRSLKRR